MLFRSGGLFEFDLATPFGILIPNASSTALVNSVATSRLERRFPLSVLPLVLVAARDLSLPTSSQSAARSVSFCAINISEMEGFFRIGDLGSVMGEETEEMVTLGVVVPEPDDEGNNFLALNHFLTPSRVVGSFIDPDCVGVAGVREWGEGMEK